MRGPKRSYRYVEGGRQGPHPPPGLSQPSSTASAGQSTHELEDNKRISPAYDIPAVSPGEDLDRQACGAPASRPAWLPGHRLRGKRGSPVTLEPLLSVISMDAGTGKPAT